MFEAIWQVVFQGLILGFLKIMKFIGLFVLKLAGSNDKTMEALSDSYKDSKKPYFIGFGLTIGIIFLIVKLI